MLSTDFVTFTQVAVTECGIKFFRSVVLVTMAVIEQLSESACELGSMTDSLDN